jgi:hypothetical protein
MDSDGYVSNVGTGTSGLPQTGQKVKIMKGKAIPSQVRTLFSYHHKTFNILKTKTQLNSFNLFRKIT